MLVKIIFQISILAICILVSTACRTADGPQFDPLESYKGSDSLVFIYRPTPSYAYGGGLAPDILIDGNKIIDLKSMGYTRVFLKPGSHSLTLKRAHAYKSRRESVYAFTIPENTRRCFIRIALPHSIGQDLAALTINATFSLATKIYFPLVGETESKSGSGFVMYFIDEIKALEEIKNCRYLYPELDSL